ncbi:uncharacterized protein [Anas platyrhynchos]|uniref:uncharacterized protein isoform X7 n=1 Tax=Anas platyrhynchos TaxID=8839 RepID=UPI003AF2EEEA
MKKLNHNAEEDYGLHLHDHQRDRDDPLATVCAVAEYTRMCCVIPELPRKGAPPFGGFCLSQIGTNAILNLNKDPDEDVWILFDWIPVSGIELDEDSRDACEYRPVGFWTKTTDSPEQAEARTGRDLDSLRPEQAGSPERRREIELRRETRGISGQWQPTLTVWRVGTEQRGGHQDPAACLM